MIINLNKRWFFETVVSQLLSSLPHNPSLNLSTKSIYGTDLTRVPQEVVTLRHKRFHVTSRV